MKYSNWKYYTKINPLKKDLDPLTIASNKFIEEITTNNSNKIIINTNGNLNNIEVGTNLFYKDRFLSDRTFKRKLIDIYNLKGIYMKGPREIIKSDNTSTNTWIIELSEKN